jgi:hypothetical protein
MNATQTTAHPATQAQHLGEPIQGRVLGGIGASDPLRAGFRSSGGRQSSATYLDLPRHLPLRVNPGFAGEQQIESAEYLRSGDHGNHGRFHAIRLRRERRKQSPKWHGLFIKWPNTTSYFLCGSIVAALIEVIQVIPK